jgi:hypothetical protein
MREFIKAACSYRKGSRKVRQCGRAARPVAKQLKGDHQARVHSHQMVMFDGQAGRLECREAVAKDTQN